MYGFAGVIGHSENMNQQVLEIIDIAALLHDIGIPEAERKCNSCAGRHQEQEWPPIARDMLSKLNIDPGINNAHAVNKYMDESP